mmetsp:Transcript_48936/g.59016  ORF Transcript_48936/g.59016 Transcript_48936/m.59016 type:complete len:222 (+) Transcript_48936:35-700(+)|eukprot:CAMPEP_0194379202 /NCGR_PEP_ID=MMETSP0174-20130528/38522_1 /TAXON_ID=216777 /ORGANISM="Proboscia alata, Strain PI-D3" /LENGTH=221 /DNA_ID=CAMNT_0039161759 /DNA_START=20 /DNA_END=685 /DNA_ORIENTATION=-
MDNAKPGHDVEFHGLKGAAHLNGKIGHLVEFLEKEQRWAVRCDDEDYQVVNAKPANLKRVGDVKEGPEVFVHPLTGQYMVPKKTPMPAPDPNAVINNIKSLHEAVLGAFYYLKKGGVVISCGSKYMMAIEFDSPHGNGGVNGEMVYADKDRKAQSVVRKRGCERATELGRNFLAGETTHYIDTTDEHIFFRLLDTYCQGKSTQGYIDMKSGLKLYNVRIAK